MLTKERALKIITEWLVAQSQQNREGAPYADVASPTDTLIDGRLNLVQLAEALATADVIQQLSVNEIGDHEEIARRGPSDRKG